MTCFGLKQVRGPSDRWGHGKSRKFLWLIRRLTAIQKAQLPLRHRRGAGHRVCHYCRGVRNPPKSILPLDSRLYWEFWSFHHFHLCWLRASRHHQVVRRLFQSPHPRTKSLALQLYLFDRKKRFCLGQSRLLLRESYLASSAVLETRVVRKALRIDSSKGQGHYYHQCLTLQEARID